MNRRKLKHIGLMMFVPGKLKWGESAPSCGLIGWEVAAILTIPRMLITDFRGTGMKAGVAHPAVYTHPMIGTFPHVSIAFVTSADLHQFSPPFSMMIMCDILEWIMQTGYYCSGLMPFYHWVRCISAISAFIKNRFTYDMGWILRFYNILYSHRHEWNRIYHLISHMEVFIVFWTTEDKTIRNIS